MSSALTAVRARDAGSARARLQQSESRAVDSAPYLELEERRRRAEEGKREALRELDLAAEEVSRVRAAKAQLEDRLQVSLAQMSGGGATGTTVDGEYEEWSNGGNGNGDGDGHRCCRSNAEC